MPFDEELGIFFADILMSFSNSVPFPFIQGLLGTTKKSIPPFVGFIHFIFFILRKERCAVNILSVLSMRTARYIDPAANAAI